MKKIFMLAMMLCLMLCAGCALADEPPFTISPSTGWSWSQTDYMLTIGTPGSYTISNWGESGNPVKLDKYLRVYGVVSGEVELTFENVHLQLTNNGVAVVESMLAGDKVTLNFKDSTLEALQQYSVGVQMRNYDNVAEIILDDGAAIIGDTYGIVISGETMAVDIIGEKATIEGDTQSGIFYDSPGFAKLMMSGEYASIKGKLFGIQAPQATGAEFDISGKGAVIEGGEAIFCGFDEGVDGNAELVIDGDGAQIKGGYYGIRLSGSNLQNAGVTLGKNVTISTEGGYGSALNLNGKNNALYILGEEDPGVEAIAGEDMASAEANWFGPFTAKSENIYQQIKALEAKFLKTRTAIKRAAADSLPRTGDPSMLGAWLALLGMSAAGMKLRKKH